jgi:hypothetical protein
LTEAVRNTSPAPTAGRNIRRPPNQISRLSIRSAENP